jgi:hypothetical protein
MLKKILLTILIVMSWIEYSSATDYNCGNVWYKYNNKENITIDEFNSCKNTLIKYYQTEFYLEYEVYKDDENYCYNTWVKSYMRRNTTKIEDRLCSKELTKYTNDYMERKRSVIRY